MHYWYPGLGYGGSCFPKDVKELATYSRTVGETDSLFIKIDELNENRIPKLMLKYDKFVNGFNNKTVAILGLSFKPNTNDMRVAPSLKVIPWLIQHGAIVKATDPQAIHEAKPLLPSEVKYSSDEYETMKGADVIMLLIEWDKYKNLDLNRIYKSSAHPVYFIDTRNQYKPHEIEKYGFIYKGIGR